MRIRYLTLAIPLVLAACGSSAGSPSQATTSSAEPSVAVASPMPSATVSSPQPSAPPSASAAPPDAFTTFRDETARPALDEISTALTRWGEAFTTAAAAGATDTDQIAFSNAAFRLRTALASASALLAEEVPDLSDCGLEAQQEAQNFVAKLTEDSQDLLAETSASQDQLAAATTLITEAAAAATTLTQQLDQACA